MDDRELSVVSYEKDLGVWISADMKCFKQSMYACNKAMKVLGMIKRTITFKDMRVMLSLYKSLVRPHIEYCISAWSPHYKKDKEIIEKVQRRFTKMVNNMERKPYEERLYCLKLWTLEERRNRQDLIEVFKMCNGLSRLKLNEFFTLADTTRGIRGHSMKLVKFRCTRDCCKYFVSNRVINRWNQLDQRVVDASSINAFNGWLNKIRETRMGFFMD